jgi:signal transduction histidine kinase
MKRKLDGLLQHYVAALRKHLKHESQASLQAASRLGHEAITFGLETVELVRIHERALILVKPSVCKTGLVKRAENFFINVIAPIVRTDWATNTINNTLDHLKDTASRRAVVVPIAHHQLQRGPVRRKVEKNDLQKSGKHKDKSLGESLQLEKHLRRLAHRVLAAQENERKIISCELHDEIAQTLLGINVRLLSLKQKARSNPKSLKNEIVRTQRLVTRSAKSMRLFARELHSYQGA